MIINGGNKIVATLRADGNVYPTKNSLHQHSNLSDYKIKTENDVMPKNFAPLGLLHPTIVDLGKQLLQYAKDSNVKGVRNSIYQGSPFTSDWLGMTALHFAAMNNELDICTLLLKGGINKDAKTKVDRTPLHFACTHGHQRIVELLLNAKCSVNVVDMLNMTPLHWAIEKGHKSIVRLLIQHNADVTIVSKFGKTPIAIAVLTEQADILQELEAAKQAQANRKLNDENAKETSEAVNSIVDFSPEESNSQIESGEEMTNTGDYTETPITNFANMKNNTGMLNNTAINLLKSHGISMVNDEDDTSKHVLNNALQNGRQLVLSEGGKLLLNETKRIQLNNNNNSNINKNNVNISKLIPVRVKTEPVDETMSKINRTRLNPIEKAKDNFSLSKNKNIRVISLNDFKKYYNNTNVKTIQKLPPSLANSRLVRQLTGNSKMMNVQQNNIGLQQLKLHQRQINNETTDAEMFNEDDLIEEDEEFASPNIGKLAPTDSDAETSDIDAKPAVITIKKSSLDMQPVRQFFQTRRIEQKLPLPTLKKVGDIKPYANIKSESNSSTTNNTNINKPNVVQLLSMPEVCRQLFDLRKQNEELKRKLELTQNNNELLQQRLDRLEEIFYVDERADYVADDDIIES